jgi:DNA-binding LacI/PurR family transcriptional regulator
MVKGMSVARSVHSLRSGAQSHRDTYLKFCHEHGLETEPALMIQTSFTQEGGYDTTHQLLELPEPPTAIFAVNDIIALGAIQAAHMAGCRVPQELSIIGMDDIFASETTYPPLTTVAKPKYEIGATAAQYLLARIQDTGQEEPFHTLLPCKLIERHSTAPPV